MGRLQLAESPIGAINVSDYYINVPTEDGRIIKVREDKFDSLDNQAWHDTMDYLEQFNTAPSVNGLFSKWRENRAQRKDERTERKTAKITARAEGRALVAKEGGGIGGALKNIGGVVGSIFGGGSSDQGAMPTQRDISIGYTSETPKWYQNPTVIIGGVAVLGLGAYLLTRNKNKSKR